MKYTGYVIRKKEKLYIVFPKIASALLKFIVLLTPKYPTSNCVGRKLKMITIIIIGRINHINRYFVKSFVIHKILM
jgi:hypothetical protein